MYIRVRENFPRFARASSLRTKYSAKCLSLVYYYIIDENSSQRFSLSPINREIKLLQLKSWFTRFKISLEPPPPPTANKFIPQISSFLGERFLDPYTYICSTRYFNIVYIHIPITIHNLRGVCICILITLLHILT